MLKLLLILVTLTSPALTDDEDDTEPQVTLYREDGERTEVYGLDCAAGMYFPKDYTFSCACVTGVWAFYDKWCKAPISIMAGNNHCVNLQNKQLTQVSLLSSTNGSLASTVVRMTAGMEQMLEKYDKTATVNWNTSSSSFAVVGGSAWNMETAQGKSYCLWHMNPYHVCLYSAFDSRKNIRRIDPGCSAGAHLVMPQSCFPFQTEGNGVCEDAGNTGQHSQFLGDTEYKFSEKAGQRGGRIARQAPPDPNAAPADPNAAPPADPNAAAPPPADPNAAPPGGAPATSGNGTAAGPDPKAQAANDAAATEDEDFVDPAQSAVKNNPIILDQLKNYLDGSINDVTGASPFTTSNRFPIFDLLDLTSKIMASTCAIVSADHFKLSVNTFINIQNHALQVREPYIAEPTFQRIKEALTQCLLGASPYNFVFDDPVTPPPADGTPNTTTAKPPIVCEGDIPPNATHSVLRDDAVMNISMPVANSGEGFEPIIETTWKMFLNAHNYCFTKFSEYYNDHHSFTVALLNFFTNDIQSMWYPITKNGTYEEPAPGGKLYGGLIGDHRYLMGNIDLCVAASRIGSPYPWLMSRPPKDETNKWSRRRRRSTMVSHGEVCLTSPTDIYTKVNKRMCK